MTEFVFLSRYDSSGYPDLINSDGKNDIQEHVPNDLILECNEQLPSGATIVDSHPEWIKKSDLSISADCELTLTFVTESAGYKNGLGYYWYDVNNPPNKFTDVDRIFIVFLNASALAFVEL